MCASLLVRCMTEDCVLGVCRHRPPLSLLWLRLLLGMTPRGMEPTGVSMLAPDEPAPPAALSRRELPLLPPVL
jgi:hypothetical protein